MDEPKARATDRPWRTFLAGSEGVFILPNTGDKREDMKYIAMVGGRDLQTDQANAALIVSALNAAPIAESLARAVLKFAEEHEEYDKCDMSAYSLRGQAQMYLDAVKAAKGEG